MSPRAEHMLNEVLNGRFSLSDVKALLRAVRAMERLANEADLQTTVGNRVERLIKPEEIINSLEEALK